MSHLRCVSPLLGLLAVALPLPAQQPPPDPVALLDRCLENLAKAAWVETTFRHHLHGRHLLYAAEGKHIVAPQRKASLYECRVKLGNASGLLQIFCDGERVWRILENGPSRDIRTYPLARLLEAREKIDKTLLGPERTAQLLRDDDAEHGFLGLRGILEEMKERLAWSRAEVVAGPQNRPLYVLEGEWSKAYLDKLAPPRKEGTGTDLRELWTKRTGFIHVPRRCRLHLGQDNLWPYRIEWWGPAVPEGKDELLVSVEYSDPILKPTVPDTQIAQVFQPSEVDKQAAEELDPVLVIRAREQNLLRQMRQEAEANRDQPTLDPTAPLRRP